MTLIEMSVVITILLTLFSVLFIGAQSWRRGSDRAACIVTQRNIQVAVRSYQNLYGYSSVGRPYADYGTQDIARHVFEKGYIERALYELASGQKTCFGNGTYQRPSVDVFPMLGVLYAQCSLSISANHAPSNAGDW